MGTSARATALLLVMAQSFQESRPKKKALKAAVTERAEGIRDPEETTKELYQKARNDEGPPEGPLSCVPAVSCAALLCLNYGVLDVPGVEPGSGG